jgi:hypothetical protein
VQEEAAGIIGRFNKFVADAKLNNWITVKSGNFLR